MSDTVFEDAEGDGDQEWEPDERYARYESDWLDAAVDRMREERHFGY